MQARRDLPRGQEQHPGLLLPELGEDDLRGALADAGDRVEPLDLADVRGKPRLDFRGELADRLVEKVDVAQQPPDEQAVMVAESSPQGLAQRRLLGPHPPFGHGGEDRRIVVTVKHRGDHRAARDAEDEPS